MKYSYAFNYSFLLKTLLTEVVLFNLNDLKTGQVILFNVHIREICYREQVNEEGTQFIYSYMTSDLR